MSLEDKFSIIPSTGVFGSGWPSHLTITQGQAGSLSTAGWTIDNPLSDNFGNEAFVQQTFLGASITSFDISAGFGDTTSTLSIQLVNDEFHTSDGLGLGLGDDVYHNGLFDTFRPPVVGSPVYFKFGKNPATVEQAFRQTFDNIYGIQTLPPRSNPKNAWGQFFPQRPFNSDEFQSLPKYHFVDLLGQVVEDRSALWDVDTPWRGRNHFVFGGILQSYSQNKSSNGTNFSVTVNDPREILSSVDILFNSYQGSVFSHKNLINVYGFLEYDPSDALMADFNNSKIDVGVVNKFVDNSGRVDYAGLSSEWSPETGWQNIEPPKVTPNLKDEYSFSSSKFPPNFPITGQGFSRRTDKGIPWYRVSQAISAMLEYFGPLPKEYLDAGFGGRINFRGYNYVVDFSGIPTDKIPLLYYLDFDKLDMLSLAQELCEVISHELYVTLLPVIDHPACKFLYDYNNRQILLGNNQNIVAGIIRLDAIDKTIQPSYGAIKAYLDNLSARGIVVENQDVGFELSNVTTDKFVVGGQEIDMYLFSSERDRDDLWTSTRENDPTNLKELQQSQWNLETQENQQVLPYYGMLGKDAVSIPRGFGPYQQILLDATEINAYGVGNYYVATELELRAALVSYDAWKNFLLSYNDVYIEDISDTSTALDALTAESNEIGRAMDEFWAGLDTDGLQDPEALLEYTRSITGGKLFAVSVPRCVWDSDKPFVVDGYPASPCSPPFGYPLYYKRATRIGIVEAGIASVLNSRSRMISDIEDLKNSMESIDSPLLKVSERGQTARLQSLISRLEAMKKNGEEDTSNFKNLLSEIAKSTKILQDSKSLQEQLKSSGKSIAYIEDLSNPGNSEDSRFLFNIDNTARRHNENAKKVYEFVRKVADECLGKKFLVRVPKSCNINYGPVLNFFDPGSNFNIKNGPFGFPPRPINDSAAFSPPTTGGTSRYDLHHHYLSGSNKYTSGALKGNYNPFTEKWEWNYKPEPQGGFYSNSLFDTSVVALDYFAGKIPYSALPPVMRQGLLPIDAQKLISDSNRLSCYVKYDNSHMLDFTGINSEDIVQQTITEAGTFVPDVIEDLFNYDITSPTNFNIIQQEASNQSLSEKRKPSIAFVKCSLDEKLYMPPKLETKSRVVWASKYEFVFSMPEISVDEIFDEGGCPISQQSQPRGQALFSVPKDGGPGKSVAWTDFKRRFDKTSNSWLIDGSTRNLDSEHVYALITIPGRIKSTADVRWKDGPAQAYQTVQKKHLMTQDVVKIPEFNEPALPDSVRRFKAICGQVPKYSYDGDGLAKARLESMKLGLGDKYWLNNSDGVLGYSPGSRANWFDVGLGQVSRGMDLAKQISQQFTLAQPQIQLGYTSPSPIFPDIVALPLMSMERCYGPWLSAGGVGGKVEFIKDENLAPWNYAGYQLLNEAGSLQTQFSSSLLLFSERGGFVIPDAPTGIALASALRDEGPLVTSINIAVDQSNGVKTTVKLDLYTPKFGKLQKQKEEAIGRISRERQRLLDEKNSALRRGLGKRQSSVDLVTSVMNAGGDSIVKKATEITRQITTNTELGKDTEETYLIWDDSGKSSMKTASQIQDIYNSANIPPGEMGRYTSFGVASMWQPYGIIGYGNVKDLPNSEAIKGKILGD